MKTANITELNSIQKEWMELDCNAPKKEQERVFSLMERMPESFISLQDDGMAIAMWKNQPMNKPMPLADVIEFHGANMDSVGIAWKCPQWVEI